LRITVARHREFSGEWRVSAAGRLEIPERGAFGVGEFSGEAFARDVGPVTGLSPAEAANRIAKRLKPFCRRRPRVSVELLGRVEGRP
jgi:protein involved in polysaccharide export with SLBB domain